MKGFNSVIGMRLKVRSNKTETLVGRITKQKEISKRITLLTVNDLEFGTQYQVRVPNRALGKIREDIPYKGEIYKIY